MLTDADYDELPDDPVRAFLIIEEKCREKVELGVNSARAPYLFKAYSQTVYAFADEVGISLDIQKEPPRTSESATILGYYRVLRDSVDTYIARVRARQWRERVAVKSDVSLSDSYKKRVHSLISGIREIIFHSALSEQRREVILSRLNALAEEVDRDRSKLQALTAVWLDLTRAVGEGFENLKPALDRLDRIGGLFGVARDTEQGGALPPPEEMKRLCPPDDDSSAGLLVGREE